MSFEVSADEVETEFVKTVAYVERLREPVVRDWVVKKQVNKLAAWIKLLEYRAERGSAKKLFWTWLKMDDINLSCREERLNVMLQSLMAEFEHQEEERQRQKDKLEREQQSTSVSQLQQNISPVTSPSAKKRQSISATGLMISSPPPTSHQIDTKSEEEGDSPTTAESPTTPIPTFTPVGQVPCQDTAARTKKKRMSVVTTPQTSASPPPNNNAAHTTTTTSTSINTDQARVEIEPLQKLLQRNLSATQAPETQATVALRESMSDLVMLLPTRITSTFFRLLMCSFYAVLLGSDPIENLEDFLKESNANANATTDEGGDDADQRYDPKSSASLQNGPILEIVALAKKHKMEARKIARLAKKQEKKKGTGVLLAGKAAAHVALSLTKPSDREGGKTPRSPSQHGSHVNGIAPPPRTPNSFTMDEGGSSLARMDTPLSVERLPPSEPAETSSPHSQRPPTPPSFFSVHTSGYPSTSEASVAEHHHEEEEEEEIDHYLSAGRERTEELSHQDPLTVFQALASLDWMEEISSSGTAFALYQNDAAAAIKGLLLNLWLELTLAAWPKERSHYLHLVNFFNDHGGVVPDVAPPIPRTKEDAIRDAGKPGTPLWKKEVQRLEQSFELLIKLFIEITMSLHMFRGQKTGKHITVLSPAQHLKKLMMRSGGGNSRRKKQQREDWESSSEDDAEGQQGEDIDEYQRTFRTLAPPKFSGAEAKDALNNVFHPSYKVRIGNSSAVCIPEVPSPAIARFVRAGTHRAAVTMHKRRHQLRAVNHDIDRGVDAEKRREILKVMGNKAPPAEAPPDASDVVLKCNLPPSMKISPLLSRESISRLRTEGSGGLDVTNLNNNRSNDSAAIINNSSSPLAPTKSAVFLKEGVKATKKYAKPVSATAFAKDEEEKKALGHWEGKKDRKAGWELGLNKRAPSPAAIRWDMRATIKKERAEKQKEYEEMLKCGGRPASSHKKAPSSASYKRQDYFDKIIQGAKPYKKVVGTPAPSATSLLLYVKNENMPLEKVMQYRVQERQREDDLYREAHGLPPRRKSDVGFGSQGSSSFRNDEEGEEEPRLVSFTPPPPVTPDLSVQAAVIPPALAPIAPSTNIPSDSTSLEQLYKEALDDDRSLGVGANQQQSEFTTGKPPISSHPNITATSPVRAILDRSAERVHLSPARGGSAGLAPERHLPDRSSNGGAHSVLGGRALLKETVSSTRPRTSLEIQKTRERAIVGAPIQLRSQALQDYHKFKLTEAKLGRNHEVSDDEISGGGAVAGADGKTPKKFSDSLFTSGFSKDAQRRERVAARKKLKFMQTLPIGTRVHYL